MTTTKTQKKKSEPAASTMQRSWLVQRLEKPHGATILGRDNPFAFGGGLRNGGLSGEAMDLLRDVFAFDYMGAAEFEFGAVPKALRSIAQDAKDLAAYMITIPLAAVPPSWRAKNAPSPAGDATVYILARANQADEVTERITAWTREEFPRLKESLHLTSTLRPASEYDGRTVGWLELDNGFMFFTNRPMWEQACALFGATTAADPV